MHRGERGQLLLARRTRGVPVVQDHRSAGEAAQCDVVAVVVDQVDVGKLLARDRGVGADGGDLGVDDRRVVGDLVVDGAVCGRVVAAERPSTDDADHHRGADRGGEQSTVHGHAVRLPVGVRGCSGGRRGQVARHLPLPPPGGCGGRGAGQSRARLSVTRDCDGSTAAQATRRQATRRQATQLRRRGAGEWAPRRRRRSVWGAWVDGHAAACSPRCARSR